MHCPYQNFLHFPTILNFILTLKNFPKRSILSNISFNLNLQLLCLLQNTLKHRMHIIQTSQVSAEQCLFAQFCMTVCLISVARLFQTVFTLLHLIFVCFKSQMFLPSPMGSPFHSFIVNTSFV